MRQTERGFLLLSSHLGSPERRVLSPAQLRTLASRMQNLEGAEAARDLAEQDLVKLGYGREMARRILGLLAEEDLLEAYLVGAKRLGCLPITRASETYPVLLRQRLGLDSPGCLWAKGDLGLLNRPAVALVGSRELREENRAFAQAVGRWAAEQGMVLVSGNARGADRTAQEACLAAGGSVISIVADALCQHAARANVLYLSEDGYAEGFSVYRALSRNRCIHALGRMVFVAQAELGKGGSWDGTVKNLRFGWSSVACFRDGSEAAARLEQMGAVLVDGDTLPDLEGICEDQGTFFDV